MFKKKKTNPLLDDEILDDIITDDIDNNIKTSKSSNKSKKSKDKKEKVSKNMNFQKLKIKFKDLTSSQKLGLYLILGTLAIMFIVSPLANTVQTFNETTVIVATTPIPKGSKITSGQIKEVTSIKNNNIPQIYLTMEQVVGTYAVSNINANGIIDKSNISISAPSKNQYLYELPPYKKAISITVPSSASSLSSKIMAGDIVSIYSYDNRESDEFKPSALFPELEYVKVLDVSNSDDIDIDDTSENIQIHTVTLLVDNIQAMILLGMEQNSVMHLALVSRGDTIRAEQLLDTQYKINNDTNRLNKGVIYE